MKAYQGFMGLFTLSALSFWALQSAPQELLDVVKTEPKQVIDYFSLDYTKVQMNSEGILDNKLQSEYVMHYQEKDEIHLTRPIIFTYKPLTPEWVTHSETGLVTEGGEHLFLQGKVTIDRVADTTHRAVTIVTRDLHVQPNSSYAETDQRAELVTGLDRMAGVGVQFFYKEPMVIKLLSQVRGQHAY